MRRFVFALLLLLVATVGAAAFGEPPTGRLEAFVELPAETPYIGEPLRLVLRSAIHGRIANDRIVAPALGDFDWQQFGIDTSKVELVDGYWTPVFTRVLMIYPLRAGRLTVPPFRRRVSYLVGDNARAEMDFESEAVTFDVRSAAGAGDPKAFWLPAKALRLTEEWEPAPDRLPLGAVAKRTIIVEADGVTAERMPPLPEFRAPGVIAFAGPVERSTIVTDSGPIGRAVYRWSLRPASAAAAIAPAIRVPWFDITSRVMREARAPERRIAFESASAPASPPTVGLLSPLPMVAASLAFVVAAATICLAAFSRLDIRVFLRRRVATEKALWTLRVIARRGDLVAFRRTLAGVAKADPDGWRRVVSREQIARDLAAIDAALYGAHGSAPPPLLGMARRVAVAMRGSSATTG